MATLGIFVKHPIPGRVKTRLAECVGAERAARLYGAFLHDVARRFRRTAEGRVLCYTPGDVAAANYFRDLAGTAYETWQQPDAELGQRMAAFFQRALRHADDRAVIVGSDSPTLPAAAVETAFEWLGWRDCVLGPATDGGYYLIGLKGRVPPIFADIEWSGPGVLRQTVERLGELDLSLGLLQPWYDVDTAADLELLRGHLLALQLSGDATDVRETALALSDDTATKSGPV